MADVAHLAPHGSAPAWLEPLRGRAPTAAVPGRRQESFLNLDLAPFHEPAAQAGAAANGASPAFASLSLQGPVLVFVDGALQLEQCRLEGLPAGTRLAALSQLEGEDVDRARQQLGRVADLTRHPFAAMNTRALADGAYLYLPPGTELAAPVEIVWQHSGAQEATVNARLLVHADRAARVQLVERFVGAQSGRTNSVTELVAERDAHLDYTRLQECGGAAVHMGGVHAELAQGAALRGFYLGLGSVLQRVDVQTNLVGEGADAQLAGIYLPGRGDQVDYHTSLNHLAPRCTSRESFRGLVGERGRAIFNGRIYIARDAQKTRAELSNKNLLLSPKAEVFTKPELEIYADDVQCAHGATVAEISAESLHYLQSRGIGAEAARAMLSFGFINELVDHIQSPPLAEAVREALNRRFAALAEPH